MAIKDLFSRKAAAIPAPAEPTFTQNQVNDMMKNAVGEAIANASGTGVNDNIRTRMAQLMSGGYDFSDTLHNVYLDYGYPAQLEFSSFWNMYRRFGIAKNVIELPVDAGWSSTPKIEGSDQFNSEFDKLINKISFWVRLKGLDTRQRVGRYAGLYMRVRDGKDPSQPIEGTLSGVNSLVDMTPLYESQLEVIETDTNPNSETFGQPLMFQYSGGSVGSRNEKAVAVVDIHASRVIIAAEGADNGWIYGVPALEAVFNSLMDLRKIIGAGGEGFYKNAAQNIVFELKDASSATANAKILGEFNEHYDEFAANRSRRAMWTPGLTAHTLESSLSKPKEFFDVALNDVAAGCTPPTPATILIGQQTGRLASGEDSKQFLSGVQSRRENFMTDMVESVIDWFMKFGILPASEYEVIWDDLLARSDTEKLTNSKTMAEVNASQFTSGGDVPFSGEEIREAGGYEPDGVVEVEGEEIEPDED